MTYGKDDIFSPKLWCLESGFNTRTQVKSAMEHEGIKGARSPQISNGPSPGPFTLSVAILRKS